MNIRELDLNLLLVFDAIYRERKISGAAKKLGMSQPAVSNALRRLRDFTGDALFFRSGNVMMPTRAANSLATPIGYALSSVEESLSAVRSFDPFTSTRRFRIGFNDVFRAMLVPALVGLVENEAPNIVLEMVVQDKKPQELQVMLRDGELDTAMLPRALLEEDMSHEVLINDQLILIVRKGHPALEKPVTKETLSKLRYVATSSSHALRQLADEKFEELGVTRQIVCVMPDTSMTPAIIEASDTVGVIGYVLAKQILRDHPITVLNTPLKMPKVAASLAWSKTVDEDQGHKWMRQRIAQIIKSAISMNA